MAGRQLLPERRSHPRAGLPVAADGTFPQVTRATRRTTAAQRQQQALELSLRGYSSRRIGEALGVSHTRAQQYLRAALEDSAKRTAELGDTLRDRERERLEAVIDSLWNYRDDPAAANAIRSCGQQIAKLYGLEAPQRLEHSGSLHTGPDLSALTDEQLDTLESWLEGAALEPAAIVPGQNGHGPG